MKTNFTILSAILLSALPALAGSPAETPIATPAAPSEWTCGVIVYGWVEGLDGDAGVKGFTLPVDVKFNEILDNLDFAAMGAVEIGYGRWGFVADGMYANIGDSASGSRGASVDVTLEQFVGNFALSYEVMRTQSLTLAAYAGVRVNSINLDFDFKGPRGRRFDASGSETWVDPIIGMRLQAELPNNFFFRATGDVGGFDVSSQFTWQAIGTFGYHLTESSSLLLGYRAIGTDYTNSGFTYNIVSSGLILGYQYAF
jgi:hypothetical protein